MSKLLVLCVILSAGAIIHQCFEDYTNSGLSPDQALQIGAAQSLLRGRGIAVFRANPDDLATPIREPVVNFPPGYTIAFAPVLWLIADVRWAILVVDWIAAGAFFASWLFIFVKLGDLVSLKNQVFIWAFWALIYSPTMAAQQSSDKLSLALFATSLAITLQVITGQKRYVALSVLSGLLTGAAAAVRFSYWPLVVVIPISLSVCAVKFDKRLWRAALSNVIVACGIVGAVALYQKSAAGQAAHVPDYQGTLEMNWRYLLRAVPFPTMSMGAHVSSYYAAKALHLRELIRFSFVWIASIGIVSVLFIKTVFYLKKQAVSESASKSQPVTLFVYLTGTLAVLFVTGMLAALSVFTPILYLKEFSGRAWTYVEEYRYYAPTLGFLVLAMFSTRVAFPNQLLDRAYRAASKVVVVFIGIALVMTICWKASRWLGLSAGNNLPGLYSLGQKDAEVILNELKVRGKTGFPLIYVDDNFERMLLAKMAGACIYDVRGIKDIVYKTSGKAYIVLTVTRDGGKSEKQQALRHLCKLNNGVKIADLTEAEIFYLEVWPSSKEPI